MKEEVVNQDENWHICMFYRRGQFRLATFYDLRDMQLELFIIFD